MTTPHHSPLIFAHRGASLLAPENTLAAFALAYELGAKAIECDVQCSADFVPLIIHDDTLERTTNGRGKVADFTAKEIAQWSAGAWFDQRFSEERVPRLTDLLTQLLPLGLMINLEIKPNGLSVQRLVDEVLVALQHTSYPQEKILLSSFDREVIEILARATPKSIPDYALLLDTNQADAMDFAVQHRCVSINPNVTILRQEGSAWIQRCHAAGLKACSFTINTQEESQFFLAAGLDGFFTDDSTLYG